MNVSDNSHVVTPALEIKNATVRAGGSDILHSVSWRVERGEHWFILGPNGAGKTTLVKMILGLVWPLYGAEVRVLGERYGDCDITEVKRKIAWASPFLQAWTSENMFKRWTTLDVALSGLDSTVGFYRDASPHELELAHSVLERMGADHLSDRYFDMLSSGEQVKALIARALISNPELMILDETCVYLDLRSREILLESIDALASSEKSPTILFVTQRIEEISSSFEHGLIIVGGRISVQGRRSEILTEENIRNAFNINVRLFNAPDGRMWPLPGHVALNKI